MPSSLDDIQSKIAKLGLPEAIVARFRTHSPTLPEAELIAAERTLLERLLSIPDAQLQRFRAIGERQAQVAAARATREAAAKLPPSPEDILREEEEALARAEREEADAKAWGEAMKRYGRGRVGHFDTPKGRIILRTMTLAEQDAHAARLAGAEAYQLRVEIGRESVIQSVVPSGSHPSGDAVRATLTEYPGLWGRAYDLRDALAEGTAEELMGKA